MSRRLLFDLFFLTTSIAAFLLASLAVSDKYDFQNPDRKTGAVRIVAERNLLSTKSPSFSFVHISDTHSPNESLKNILLKISESKPEFIIHTGDIVNTNNSTAFKSYLDTVNSLSGISVYHTPGNRDTKTEASPDNYLSNFGLPRYFIDVNQDWRFVFVNSDSLEIKTDDLSWLKKVLQEGKQQNRRFLLFTHCPPYNIIFRMIQYHCLKQENSDELAKALKGYDVAGFFCGHIHMPGAFNWNGVPVYYTYFLSGYNQVHIDGRSITVKQMPFQQN
jgi:predicted phosphodiesterase